MKALPIVLSESESAAKHAGMRISANKAIVQRFLDALASGDWAGMRATLAPHARLALRVAGVYSPELRAFPHGTQWNRDELIAAQTEFLQALSGPFSLEIVSMIGEGETVAAEVIGRGTHAADSRRYLQHYSFHVRIDEGAIVDIQLYQDTLHLWDVWHNAGPPARAPIKTGNPVRYSPALAATPPRSKERIAANKEIVRRFLTTIQTKDQDLARSLWAFEGVWSFAAGGDYLPELRTFDAAPRWDRDAMLRMQQGPADLKEPMTLDIYSILGEGDAVCVETVGLLVRGDGRAYRQHYSVHFKLQEEKLIEAHVYYDSLHNYDLDTRQAAYAPVAVPLSAR